MKRSYGFLFLVTALVFFLAACGDDPENGNGDGDGDGDHDNGHEEAGWVDISTRGNPATLLARWDGNDGWQDAEGNSISALPTPVQTEDGSLHEFTADGPRASLTVEFYNRDGELIEMGTESRDDDTRERECTEFSARYFPIDNETDILAWGLIQHPDADADGSFQFVERANGDVAGIFHCDHVHIYPEVEGQEDIEFVLWHFDHGDDQTDPITINVGAAE